MKLNAHSNRQSGSATIVVLILLGIVMVLLEVNFSSVKILERDMARVEKLQLRHWHSTATNAPAHE